MKAKVSCNYIVYIQKSRLTTRLDLNHLSTPKDETLPANLAPALPLFWSFSRSLLSSGARACAAECDSEVDCPLIRGREDKVSVADLPELDVLLLIVAVDVDEG